MATLVSILFVISTPSHAQLPTGWSGIDIGGGATGSETYSGGVYTIVGGGTGVGPSSDQMHFTYYTLPSGGNFRLTARVASFTGGAGSQVGLTLRQGTAPTGPMGAVAYKPASGSGTSPNLFEMFARNPLAGAYYPSRTYFEKSAMAAPCYLQFVRYGNSFAVYKSSDGIFWAQVHDSSGSAFPVSGAVQVGLYVASGGAGTATATFDNVNLDTSPILAYESSWIGNSLGTDLSEYVSSSATAMWVAPDGTCYTVGAWDEGGEVGKSYKNGAVVNGFTLAAAAVHEGGITSDGTHLYYYGARGIYQVNMAGSQSAPYQPLFLQTPLIDPTNGRLELSGLAYGNGELYVSDAYTGQILVVNPSQTTYGTGPGTLRTTVTTTIDTSGVSNPAPQEVYQTAFQSDQIHLNIPGLTVGSTYTVRLHLAELTPTDNAVGKRLMNLTVGSQTMVAYDIFAHTGAINKAIAVTFANVAPTTSGTLLISALRNPGSVDGWAILNGIEILNSDGSTFTLINCGGGVTGSWLTTLHEIPSRAFSFTRPGPITVDSAGNLWIVQEGTTYPATYNYTSTPGWAAIKLYDKNGVYLGKQITDVVNPTAVSYDSATDTLLVAENGPAQNVRIYNVYTGTGTAPACTSTLGVTGGVFAGSTPGLAYDAASGGNARFFGLSGVGKDSSGNIYVSCDAGSNQTDIRSFSSAGILNWKLQSLEMCNVGDFDPTAYAGDVWTTTHHYAMNWANTTAGSEWSLKSYTTNPFNYPFPTNLPGGNAVYRKVGGVPLLFTAGQGTLGPIYIYRFVGEQQVPCSSITDTGSVLKMWIDTNGDGIQQAGEVVSVSKHSSAYLQSFSVDAGGSIYMAMGGGLGGNSPNVQKLLFSGFNSVGAATYQTTLSYTLAPAPFNTAWGNRARCCYAGGALDTMYLMGETTPGASDLNYGGTLACFDHWATGPVQRFSKVLPTPATNPNFLNGAPPYTDGNGFLYMAMDVANSVAFCSDVWGTIHVVDPVGNLVTNILPGPEVNGSNDWEDENMGLRVHYNTSNAEYDILQEMSGLHGRQAFYRVRSLGPFLTSLDIGSVAAVGSSSLTNGVFTVNGDGADIGGTTDAFQYDYQSLAGGGTIIAHVVSISDPGGSGLAKAGVMIRESTAAGATQASMLLAPTSVQGAVFENRTITSGSTATSSSVSVAPPYWVKVNRAGNVFTGYVSSNGTTWTLVGTQVISMASSAYVGLVVTSHNNVAPCATAKFDHVTITTP